ncbi:uncharacterized protein ATC70_004366 [Mucor velutinosus]|uniref:Uncharacterized protein n=1 Tax=Mucor velutinosus TaxID=708070 RepID=A0AAN7DSF6_9FUNG|nr:hypothetical protein ATC70_004366 [Mucor velutinosus]
MIDGENCSQATKHEQQNTQKIFNDENDKKRIIGREIDLIVANCGVELSSSEWKRDQTADSTIEQQHVKNIRSNVVMLKRMLDICQDDSRISVVGMEWLGFVGCAYSIEKLQDVFLMNDAGALIVPSSLANLDSIVDTLDLLFRLKSHYLNVAAIIEPAVESISVSKQLNKLRSASEMEGSDTNPIFFTSTTTAQLMFSQNIDALFWEHRCSHEHIDVLI